MQALEKFVALRREFVYKTQFDVRRLPNARSVLVGLGKAFIVIDLTGIAQQVRC